MKRNWEYKKLGDVASFRRGLTYAKDDVVNHSSKIVLRSNNINLETSSLNFDDVVCLRDDFVIPLDKLLRGGDIFICMSNGSTQHLGKVAHVQENLNMAFGGFMGVIEPNENLTNSRYVFYCCRSGAYRSYLNSIFNGANINNLKWSDLSKFVVPVPPLDEQQRIVAELDLLTGIIDKQNAQLKELDNLAQAIFYDMFGNLSCDECALIELCVSKDDIKCGPFGTQLSKSEYQKEGVAVWGIPQINSHFIIPPSDYVSQEKAVALKDYSVVAGDIVMSRKGNVGQCSVFPDSFENGIIHSDVLRLRLDYNKANSIFMMYQLHLSDSIKHQIQLVSSGAIMPGINVTKLKNIKVQVPPLALQQSFAEKIQSIEKQKETIRASIADTQKLLDYTMDKYFG